MPELHEILPLSAASHRQNHDIGQPASGISIQERREVLAPSGVETCGGKEGKGFFAQAGVHQAWCQTRATRQPTRRGSNGSRLLRLRLNGGERHQALDVPYKHIPDPTRCCPVTPAINQADLTAEWNQAPTANWKSQSPRDRPCQPQKRFSRNKRWPPVKRWFVVHCQGVST